MAPRTLCSEWLKTEGIPQVSDATKRQIHICSVSGGLTEQTIAEMDAAIEAGTKAIRKHYSDEQEAKVRELFRQETADGPMREN